MSDILSQNEIDNLLQALSSGEVDAEEMKASSEKQVKNYDFSRPSKFSKEHLRTLEIIFEHYGRLLSTNLPVYLRKNVQVEVVNSEAVTYSEFSNALSNPVLLGIVNFAPLKGNIILEMASNLGYAIGQSQAKYHGNVVFYNIEKHKHEFGDRDLVGLIYQNIMNGFAGFSIYYQPIVNAQSGKIVGAEALIRWEDEKYGMVLPNRFIPFVEQNPCIFDLGNWVLRRALMDAQEMRKIIPDFILNVNIAAPQLVREEFRESVMQALADTGYPAKNLCLELTERCRELDFEFMRQEITFFREKGIRVAMDDFGTGNASLQLVLELPIDEIKIDRTFLKDIESRKINQVLVSAAAIGAQTIGADVCIEGVEDQRMATYLQVYEPTYYQGYHYAKPLPKEEFLSLISS